MTTETNDNRWVSVWLLFAALAVGLSSAPLLAQPADSGPGQALRVNGAGAHVAVPFDRAFAMGSGFFTIELWFRLDSLPSDAPAQFVSNDEYELGGGQARPRAFHRGAWRRLARLSTGPCRQVVSRSWNLFGR